MVEHRINNPYKLPCLQIETDGKMNPYISVEISSESPSTELKLKSPHNYQLSAYSDHKHSLSEEIKFQTVFINGDALARRDLLMTVFEYRDGDCFKHEPDEKYVFINILHHCCKITRIPLKLEDIPSLNHIFYNDQDFPFLILPRGYRYLIELVDGDDYRGEVYFVEQNGSFTSKGAPTKADLDKITIYEDLC